MELNLKFNLLAFGTAAFVIVCSLTADANSGLSQKKVIVLQKAKTWLEASRLCAKANSEHLKWELPVSVWDIVMDESLEGQKRAVAAIAFAQIENPKMKQYLMWVKGSNPAERKELSQEATLVEVIADGKGTDTGAFDIKKTPDLLKKTQAEFGKLKPDQIQAAKALEDLGNEGLTTICISKTPEVNSGSNEKHRAEHMAR